MLLWLALLPKLRSILSNFEKEEHQTQTKEGIKTSDDIRKLLKRSRFLRGIYLDGLEIGNKLPSEIGNVLHLHYLGITSCSLQEIPSSVGKLKRLQTLDVRGTDVTRLPRGFWRIPTLRHVFGSIILPRRVGNLEHLQTLQGVNPDDGGGSWDRTTFAGMKRLQTLYIWELPDENPQDALAAIYAVKSLVLLSIRGKVISFELFTCSTFTRLEVMILNGKIKAPLKESGRLNFPSLTRLSLKNTMVSQNFIDKLSEELPLLASLALLPESYEEAHLAFKSGFHSLKELNLDVDVKEIVIADEACHCLVKLDISMCWDFDLIARRKIEEIINVQDKYLYTKMKETSNVPFL